MVVARVLYTCTSAVAADNRPQAPLVIRCSGATTGEGVRWIVPPAVLVASTVFIAVAVNDSRPRGTRDGAHARQGAAARTPSTTPFKLGRN